MTLTIPNFSEPKQLVAGAMRARTKFIQFLFGFVDI